MTMPNRPRHEAGEIQLSVAEPRTAVRINGITDAETRNEVVTQYTRIASQSASSGLNGATAFSQVTPFEPETQAAMTAEVIDRQRQRVEDSVRHSEARLRAVEKTGESLANIYRCAMHDGREASLQGIRAQARRESKAFIADAKKAIKEVLENENIKSKSTHMVSPY